MQHRQAGKAHFAARIPAEFLNFLRIRKSKAENQGLPEASGAWLWFVFGYFGCLWALSLQANMGEGLLQIFVLLQQPPFAYCCQIVATRDFDRLETLILCGFQDFSLYSHSLLAKPS